eukprot:3853246-Pyramimonas_sp.AAC.1
MKTPNWVTGTHAGGACARRGRPPPEFRRSARRGAQVQAGVAWHCYVGSGRQTGNAARRPSCRGVQT